MAANSGGSGHEKISKVERVYNPKAHRIMLSHMHQPSTTTFASTSSVPLLQQIDSTAGQGARTHDISHLRDKSTFLPPRIPPSRIPPEDHIFEKTFMPKDAGSVFREDKQWHTVVFPSAQPSSRTDAVLLDKWISRSLDQYAMTMTNKGELTEAVEGLVPILSIGLHEVVRQVTHKCLERGTVLEKIWRAYVELFDRVLQEMKAALATHRAKAEEVQSQLAEAQDSLDQMRRSHPQKMQALISDLERKFLQRQRELEDDLKQREYENLKLSENVREHHNAVELWYPNFSIYQQSSIRQTLPDRSERLTGQAAAQPGGENSQEDAEVALSRDFKRLLNALPPDKRRAIGKQLASLLLKDDGKDDKALEGSANEVASNKLQQQILTQEKEIQQLQRELEGLES